MSVHRVLPGHGRRHSCSAEEMRREMQRCVERMRASEVKVVPDEVCQMLFRRLNILPTMFAAAIALGALAACRT